MLLQLISSEDKLKCTKIIDINLQFVFVLY